MAADSQGWSARTEQQGGSLEETASRLSGKRSDG
jgi:hypothetical protein